MVRYLEAIEGLPVEFKLPLIKAFESFKEEIAETVKRSDFDELKAVVYELAEAQKRTEESLESFKKTTEENFNRVWKAIDELAEAQRRTEERLESFERATEENFNRVWKAIDELTEAMVDTRKELGGLSHTIGYSLENEAYKSLPSILKRRYNLIVEGRLSRRFIEHPDGREEEIDIIGTGRIGSERLNIIGEAKSQLSIKDIDNFLKRAKRLEGVLPGRRFLLMVTHSARPSVIKHAEAKEVAVFISYEF